MSYPVDPFLLYNGALGAIATVGILYLFYVQRYVVEVHRFLYFLLAGFLVFAIGSPLTELLAPAWSHAVHGLSALFVVFALYDPVHNDLRKDEWAELVLRDPARIRHPDEWMTPMDDEILELFHSSDLVLTPSIIADNLEYSRGEVNRHLSDLTDHGYAEKVTRGKYRMTEDGEEYLSGG